MFATMCAGAAEPQSSPAATHEDSRAWLGDLPVVEAKVGWREYGKPGLIGSRLPIALNRAASPHGLSTPADATVTFAIGKKFHQFRATAALADSDSTSLHSPVVFQVLADGKPIWRSKTIKGDNRFQPCMLDVTGVDRLTLRAEVTGSNSSNFETNAVWLEPWLSATPIDPKLAPLFSAGKFLESDETNKYYRKLSALWEQEKFADLEELAKRARREPTHWLRQPKLFIFYASLEVPDADDEAGYLRLLDKVKLWQQQFPQSPTPRIVAAGAWEELAISSHGSSFGRNVTPEGWRLFIDRMVKAGAYLDEAESLGSDDPELYYRYLWLAFAQNLPQSKIDEYVDKIVQLDPAYLPAYRAMAYGLLPRWHGKPGDAARFALRIRDRLGGTTGQAAYFTVAANYCILEQCRPSEAGFKSDDLKAATIAAAKEYAGDEWVVQPGCWMACLDHDLETARLLFERIPRGGGIGLLWGGLDAAEIYRRWADPQRAPGEELKTVWECGSRLSSVVMAPDGKHVIVGGDNAIYRVGLEDGKVADTVAARDSIINWAVDPAGQRVMISTGSQANLIGSLRLHKFGSDESEPLTGHRRWVSSVAFNPAGTHAASGGSDRQALLWKLDDLDNPTAIETPTGVVCVAFSPNGKILATSTNGGGLYLWDGRTGAKLDKPLLEEGSGVAPALIQFTPDGAKLAVAIMSGEIQVWDVAARKVENSAKAAAEPVSDLMVSPAGGHLAIGHANGDIELFDIGSLNMVHKFHGHWAEVVGIDFSSDGNSMVSGAKDRTVKLWDLKPYRSGK